ncbi:hypothetical protein TB2_034592 [Malus domestica]|uniref:Uncharacterized protein n=1 Tax=Malus domestica TaxID=3750 RepID=A0A498JWY7_MALDO|nr:hypothetical protein DVH24_010036 [Malus domestica]
MESAHEIPYRGIGAARGRRFLRRDGGLSGGPKVTQSGSKEHSNIIYNGLTQSDSNHQSSLSTDRGPTLTTLILSPLNYLHNPQFGLQFVPYDHGNAARLEGVPCSIEELNGVLNGDEGMVVKELVGSTVLEELMLWASLDAKLDLHGLYLSSLYLIMLEWFEAMRHKFNCGECVITSEVVVV